MKNQKGFTLVELMVVLVIIGVLAALAIPKFGTLSGKAKLAEAPGIISSWETMQNAYVIETGGNGDGAAIGFDDRTTDYWDYAAGDDDVTATAEQAMGDCADDGTLISTSAAAADGATFTHSGTCEDELPSFSDN